MFTANEYKIVFKRRWHCYYPDGTAPGITKGDGRYDTVCEIYVQDKSMSGSGFRHVYKEEPSFIGIAKLHPNDKPDKVVGKKIALRKAMDKSFSSFPTNQKSIRTAIWKAFWQWVSSWSVGHEYLFADRTKKGESK